MTFSSVKKNSTKWLLTRKWTDNSWLGKTLKSLLSRQMSLLSMELIRREMKGRRIKRKQKLKHLLLMESISILVRMILSSSSWKLNLKTSVLQAALAIRPSMKVIRDQWHSETSLHFSKLWKLTATWTLKKGDGLGLNKFSTYWSTIILLFRLPRTKKQKYNSSMIY